MKGSGPLAIAALALLAGCSGAGTAPRAAPVTAPVSLSPSVRPAPSEHTHWYVSNRVSADVDGDGVQERVLVREPDRGRPEVDVHFRDGRVSSSRVSTRFDGDRMIAFPLDAHPGQELLVSDIVSYRFSLWTYRDRGWRRLEVARPGLLRTSVGADARGYDVLTRNDQLLSYRSVQPFDVGYDYAFPPSPVYAVDSWSWHYRGSRLSPTPAGRWCVSEDISGQLIHCP